jgi:MarR family transcriptional regulator, organic hydroperoxide resistance regulator
MSRPSPTQSPEAIDVATDDDLDADRATEAILRHWREAVPNDRLAHLVKDAMRGLQRALQMRHSRYSVSFGHWTFLRILWDTDGLTQRELSERAGLQEPTTYAALKTMEKLGYVTREQRPDSRKKVYVLLTQKGRALQADLVPQAEDVNQVALDGIAAEDIATTRRTLLVMIENLARDEVEQTRLEHRIPSTRALARLVAEAEAVAETNAEPATATRRKKRAAV